MHCLFMFSQRGAGADYEELQQGNNTCKSGNFNPIETPLNRTHARAPFPSGQSSDGTGVTLGVKSVLANQPNNNINMCDMHNKRRHFEVTSPSFVTLSSVRAYFQSRHVCRQIYKQKQKTQFTWFTSSSFCLCCSFNSPKAFPPKWNTDGAKRRQNRRDLASTSHCNDWN